ncbi:MAG: glycoside hydrolase family 3 protein [Myxococcales bacterium]|nr:glycoside hydrolase family 3 protein [Myxococcales bacterium]
MKRAFSLALVAAIALFALACSGDSTTNPPADGADAIVHDGGTDADGVVPGDGHVGDQGEVAECDKPANVQKVAAWKAIETSLEVRSKSVIKAKVSFPSAADDPSKTCEVELSFRDLNGNGTLDPYENYTLSAADRATDLVSQMTEAEKIGLMAHVTTSDAPTVASSDVSAALKAQIDSGQIRFGKVTAHTSPLGARASWANNVQALCEASRLGIPFVLSMEPSHADGGGRSKASGFSQWPLELGLGTWGVADRIRDYGKIVSKEYRAIGVRMALSVSANLATDPRWHGSQFTFGEDSAKVSTLIAAYVEGLQGAGMGAESVAAVVGRFPGAGAAKGGVDARLAKGKYLSYPGNNIDAHLAPFAAAFNAKAAAVMPAYGILESGSWSGLGGVLSGSTIEQVAASFNKTVVTDALRTHYHFDGLVLAPWGVINDAGVNPLGAPWGVESMTKSQRVAKAINAGVDQFGGLEDTTVISGAKTAGLITAAQIDAAAKRALVLMFSLGLFDNPYVDDSAAAGLVNTTAAKTAGQTAMDHAIVLLVNQTKPSGFLNGGGDGTQTGDKGNAGNGTMKVLPAPPGEPYVAAGCSYFMMGNVDWDFVFESSAGFGELTNFLPGKTDEERIALSHYVFILLDAPFTADPDSGPLELAKSSLEYATNANASVLAQIATARAAIDKAGKDTQIIVGIVGGRPSVVSEVLAANNKVGALAVMWGATTKSFLDTLFGIHSGLGTLPVGLPASDAAGATQKEDVAGDGQHATFILGAGMSLTTF